MDQEKWDLVVKDVAGAAEDDGRRDVERVQKEGAMKIKSIKLWCLRADMGLLYLGTY